MCDTAPKNFIPVPFRYHENIKLRICDINNLGVGVGRISDWVVMVPYVCIDEVVIARVYKNCKNYSLADLVEVLSPSSDRVIPKCPLFGMCGGCQYQHMSYNKQVELKKHHVSDVMKRIGNIDTIVNDCIYDDKRCFGYRSKITPHYQKKVPPIGFLDRSSRKIVDVVSCPIATQAINDEISNARNRLIQKSHDLKRGGTLLLRDVGNKVVFDHNEKVECVVNGYRFRFIAGEFFQNNPFLLPRFAEFVVQSAVGPANLIDAYCGVGFFGILAASSFDNVVGIEVNKNAIKLAKENAEMNGVGNISFISGVSEKIFDNVNFNGNSASVIIDPPRAGCDAKFLDQLLKFYPEKIVYVSCAPDTQARDLKILSQMYDVVEIQPFDMFPQTRHIENVVVLRKRKDDII